MKRKSIRTSSWLLLISSTFLPTMMAKPVEAANPTISVREQSFDASKNELTIRVESNGMITMPGGNKQSKSATLVVNKNGVYSFQAERDGHIVTDSIHVTKINKGKLRTNDANVKLKLSYKDELSGIQQVRFKNESSGTWEGWRSTATLTKAGTETINWKLNTSSEGNRSVYVQFRDQAGNITPGAAYDQIIYDVSAPTFSVSTEKYYVRDNTFKLDIKDLKDTYSPIAKVSIKVGNQPYKDFAMTDAFVKDLQDGLDIEVPAAERNKPGAKTIQIKAEDDLGNVSKPQTLEIFHDNKAPNKGDITIRTNDDKAVKVMEGGRQWDESQGGYVYFEKEDGIRLVDDQNIKLRLKLGDDHSKVTPDTAKGGYARVDVIEYNVSTNNKRKVIESSRKEVNRKTFRTEIKADGSVFVPWQLSYGLEKQIAIVVYDNAGNSQKFVDDPIYMSALSLVHFKVKDVVNPRTPWTEVDFSNPESAPGHMLAGGNVKYDIMYNLLTAQKPRDVFGSLEIITKHEESGYIHSQTIALPETDVRRKDEDGNATLPYFLDEFTIPQDAPKGSKVYATGWLKAQFDDQPNPAKDLRIYFPTKDLIVDKEIGIVVGNIHEEIQFRSVR